MSGPQRKSCFCITIDTEPDCDIHWIRSRPLTYESVVRGIPERLRPLWNRYQVKPVYFVSPEVLLNDQACAMLKEEVSQGAEIGTHLHSEYIGPDQTYTDFAGTPSKEYPCFAHEREIEQQKIANLTKQIEERLGVRPVSYRAARYGADLETMHALEALGYWVDSSVTPCIDWSRQGGPDHALGPDQPYFIDRQHYYRAGDSNLLEVPITIAGKRCTLLPDRWLFYRWLRPTHMTVWEMKALTRSFMRRYKTPVLNLMFHSMEVIPNKTPFVRSEWQCKWYLKRLEGILCYLIRCGCVSQTLADVYAQYHIT